MGGGIYPASICFGMWRWFEGGGWMAGRQFVLIFFCFWDSDSGSYLMWELMTGLSQACLSGCSLRERSYVLISEGILGSKDAGLELSLERMFSFLTRPRGVFFCCTCPTSLPLLPLHIFPVRSFHLITSLSRSPLTQPAPVYASSSYLSLPFLPLFDLS